MKNLLKIFLGKVLVFLQPRKASRLANGGMTINVGNKHTLNEKLMRHVLMYRAEKQNDFDTLAKYHRNFWEKKGREHFSKTNYTSLDDFFIPKCLYVFEKLKTLLVEQSQTFDTIVEIGTGNGDVLNYLSVQFSEIDSFIGIDLSKEQIDFNKNRHKKNSKLQFINSDGLDWVISKGKANTIFYTSGGVLEYFTEQGLKKLLRKISNLGSVIFVAIEPVGMDIDFTNDSTSRLYGHERSFTHDYVGQFKNAGYEICHESIISYKPISHNFKAIIAKC